MSAAMSFPIPPESASAVEALLGSLERVGLAVADFEAQLRGVMLDGELHLEAWIAAGLPPEQLEAAAHALAGTLTPREQFFAQAVQAGAILDSLVRGGALSSAQLAQFLQMLFTALVHREPLPLLGGPENPQLAGAQQWLCNLFVDGVNADEGVLALVPMHVDLIAAEQRTVAQLCRFLAERTPAAPPA